MPKTIASRIEKGVMAVRFPKPNFRKETKLNLKEEVKIDGINTKRC